MSTDTDRSDGDLARAVVARKDENAFRTLYRRHSPRLHRILLRMMRGSAPAAEDALQETWIRAVAGLPQFRWEASLGSWLVAIAINVSREQLRAGRPTVALVEVERFGADTDGSVRIDLEAALAALPEEGRVSVLLHDVEGYTHEEIAVARGSSPGTAKSRLSRARGALRALLAPRKEEGSV